MAKVKVFLSFEFDGDGIFIAISSHKPIVEIHATRLKIIR